MKTVLITGACTNTGVEIVESAVKDAEINAKINIPFKYFFIFDV